MRTPPTRIAFKAKSGNPMADHTAIYKSIMSATMGDTDKSEDRRGSVHHRQLRGGCSLEGDRADGATPQRGRRAVPPGAPPPQALQGLKPGMVRDFGPNKGKWSPSTLMAIQSEVGASAALQ